MAVDKAFMRKIIVTLVFILCLSISYKIYLLIVESDFKDYNFHNIKSLASSETDLDYSFAVVSSIENSNDIFEKKIIRDINGDPEIKFMLSTGNAVLDGAEEKYRILNNTLRSLRIPGIIGIGDNEVSDGGYKRFYKHFGPSYFSFTCGSDAFIFLDSTAATSFEIQEGWLLDELEEAADCRHIFVITDRNPLMANSYETEYAGGIMKIFADFSVSGVFYSGDIFEETVSDDVRYYSCGKAGGVAYADNYGYVKAEVREKAISASYIYTDLRFDSAIMRAWIVQWYRIHTFFHVHFINMVIVLSLLILLSTASYRKITVEQDYYRNFSAPEDYVISDRSLTIAMFTNNYFPFVGGVPVSIYRLASTLRKRGNRVVIFAPKYPVKAEDDFDVIRFPLLKYCESGKFKFAVANIYSPDIEREFRRFNFDVVHVHHPFWMGKKGLKLAKTANIPVVLTYHTRLEKYSENLPFGRSIFKNIISHKMIKRFAQRCDGIVAPTNSAKEYLENIGVSRPKLIMPTGIDIGAYDNLNDEDINNTRRMYADEDELLLCSVFRLSPEKNPEFLIDGLRLVRQQSKVKFKCIIIGDGPEREKLSQRIDSSGMHDLIILCGSIDPDVIPEYYRASDLFVFSSQSETQGMVLIEAMAGGCPVVCIRSSGTDDIVVNNCNGFKTGANLQEWADCVTLLINSNELRMRMSENAKTCAHRYAIETLTAELESFYKTLVAQKRML